MSNILISRYGSMASTGEKVRVMHVNGGRYYKWPDNYVIGKMDAIVKFIAQPTGYFYMSNDANHSSEGNEVHWLHHGQNYCKRSDSLGYVATACTPYQFPLGEWLDITWLDSLGGSTATISISGKVVRSVGCANWMVKGDIPYQHYIFSDGVKAYFRRLRVYDSNWAMKKNWDFQNGTGVPAGWSDCIIDEVKL